MSKGILIICGVVLGIVAIVVIAFCVMVIKSIGNPNDDGFYKPTNMIGDKDE